MNTPLKDAASLSQAEFNAEILAIQLNTQAMSQVALKVLATILANQKDTKAGDEFDAMIETVRELQKMNLDSINDRNRK